MKLSKMLGVSGGRRGRIVPRIKTSDLTGFKKSDFSLGIPSLKRRRKTSLKRMLKNR